MCRIFNYVLGFNALINNALSFAFVLVLHSRDGFSYFRSGGGGVVDEISGRGGAAACFDRGLVATCRNAKENV